MLLVGVLAALLCATTQAAPRTPPECNRHKCNTTAHPVLKYNGTCYCESHPCPVHSCDKVDGFPILTYDFNDKGRWHCRCLDLSYRPYVQKSARAGVLDCYCRKSCPNGLCGGERIPNQCSRKDHHCPNSKFPILIFSDGELENIIKKCGSMLVQRI